MKTTVEEVINQVINASKAVSQILNGFPKKELVEYIIEHNYNGNIPKSF
jgi:hypothetical protein